MSKSNTLETEQLTDAMYYILISLVEERHGYAIMRFIEERSQGLLTMGPGTLYTLLKKLCGIKWIALTSLDDDRTKKYHITKLGMEVLLRDITRRKRMVEDGITILKENGYEE